MTLHFNKRKSWYFGKNSRKSIGIEFSGWNSFPQIYLEVDPTESQYCIHLGFILGIWITMSHIMPKRWYPEGYDIKQTGISIHGWCLWWIVWMDPNAWNSTDQWYRRGNFNFERLIRGKHEVEWADMGKRNIILPFLEGNYSVWVERKLRTDRWKRWFTCTSLCWEVKCGYFKGTEFITVPVPHPGKGESSYDQDEDGTWSMSFPDRKEIRTHYEAALYFWHDKMVTREKRGSASWRPRVFGNTLLKYFKETQIT